MNQSIDVLAEHYQNTYELTYQFREQRNKTFVILLFILGIVTVLTLRVPQADSLLIDIIAKITGSTRMEELRSSFPFAILQSIFMVAVLHLIIDLHHLNLRVIRNFQYLGDLENEIRTQLRLGDDSAFFTREGKFYDTHRGPFLWMIPIVYILILSFLLVSFIFSKIIGDFRQFQYFLGIIDIVLSLFILAFFGAYTYANLNQLPMVKRFFRTKIQADGGWISKPWS
jgi:hypothetical protein